VAADDFLSTIEELLPEDAPGLDATRVHTMVDCWSRSHVKQMLQALEVQGRAASTLVDLNSTTQVRLYHRALDRTP